MSSNKSRQWLRAQPDDRFSFFQGFLRNPTEVGSVIPSSRFLERRLARSAELSRARVVVELGPGTGGTTRALLRGMQQDAKLLAIELNADFVPRLRELTPDPRLHVCHGDAADLQAQLAAHGLAAPDVVVSGIPFSTLPREVGLAILHSIHATLPVGGHFVAYQVRDRVETLGNRVFGPARTEMELRNIPPMRIYRWTKEPSAREH
jgi:phospholipid N-methyltransferase